MKFLPYYLLAITLFGFILGGYDKHAAKNKKWRIPEKNLFIVSLLGGSLGFYLSMYTFHHKTKHWYFVVFIPIIIVAQAALLYWIYFL